MVNLFFLTFFSLNFKQQKKSVSDYEYYRILGGGSFGKVILVKDKISQKYYAMKIISKEKFM